jgi:CDP-diacylglycerol--glycerol-3-phosphate 3-phosphatidyltransferase
MNVPNLLTALRIVSIPALVIVLLTQFQGKELIGFGIFAFATFTDTLDGFWARKKKQITVFGQLLDPIADKLLITSALICLVELGLVSAWMAVIIIGREIAVTGFRAIASSKGFNIPASLLGKAKMILETITVSLLILGKPYLGHFYFLSQVGLWLTVATAIFSAAEYYIKYGPRVLSNRSSNR